MKQFSVECGVSQPSGVEAIAMNVQGAGKNVNLRIDYISRTLDPPAIFALRTGRIAGTAATANFGFSIRAAWKSGSTGLAGEQQVPAMLDMLATVPDAAILPVTPSTRTPHSPQRWSSGSVPGGAAMT